MENQDNKPKESNTEDLQKVLKGEPLGDILKDWASPKKGDE